MDRDRRRSAPSTTYDSIDSKSPVRLARDLLQVVQETVFAKKLDETPKRCPLVKEESDLTTSDEEEGTDRIANLIDFFFTIVKSQKEGRKGSSGSCFRAEVSPDEEKCIPTRVNTELEKKMETLMEFLATTGCIENEEGKDDKKITLMEFLFGPDERKWETPLIEINGRNVSLSESNVNVKNLSFIDETPVDDNETLVEMLLKYMENYGSKEKFKDSSKSMSITPSLSEKSKSDTTISRLETFSDVSKTKSDSTLTHTQDTVIELAELKSDKTRRISETVIDLSFIKEDLENIFEEAIIRICELKMIFEDDTMSDQEDLENFTAYTKPPTLQYIQCLPYSVELSDIIEEDEPSSRALEKISEEDRLTHIKQLAEDVIREIERKIQRYPFEDDDSSGPSTEEYSREYELSTRSISLIDLRNIPDLPPSMIIKPKVLKLDKSTSTTEISESISEISRRIDSYCMTEDTSLSSSSERNDRAMDKIESLHKFFSKSRLEIIDESLEENGDRIKSPKLSESNQSKSEIDKVGQASLDDVEDIQDDCDLKTDDVSEIDSDKEKKFELNGKTDM